MAARGRGIFGSAAPFCRAQGEHIAQDFPYLLVEEQRLPFKPGQGEGFILIDPQDMKIFVRAHEHIAYYGGVGAQASVRAAPQFEDEQAFRAPDKSGLCGEAFAVLPRGDEFVAEKAQVGHEGASADGAAGKRRARDKGQDKFAAGVRTLQVS